NSPPVTVHSGGFWATTVASGHRWGWHRSQKNRAIFLFPSRPISATGTSCARRKMQNPTSFNPNFKELVLSHFFSKFDESCDRERPTVRSEPNLQDEYPIPYRTHRNFRIGVWRSWSPWARLTRVRSLECQLECYMHHLKYLPGFWIHYEYHQVKVRSHVALSGVETDPIRGVGCTGVWGDIMVVWYGRTWRRLYGVLTGPIRGVGSTGVWGDYV
ncbi:AP2/B3-like transcriptional factor family protein, partial [Prunus dulcis]